MVEIEIEDTVTIFSDFFDDIRFEALVTHYNEMGFMIFYDGILIWSEPDVSETIKEIQLMAKVFREF